MLLRLDKLIERYNMKITGVIQAGAHEGEEIDEFVRLGITTGSFFEPCEESFNKLLKKKNRDLNYYFYRSALGSKMGCWLQINKTKFNGGQSNSLLQPKRHLDYYPNIIFDETEEVVVNILDWFNTLGANLLVMDVQGYELEILKGATKTMKEIDYIYTEVNREELYENCAMVEDLDNYLTDFKRVETKWKRRGFGDALYIRKTLL